jgi:CRISPR-associated protein (TIGR03986 family)
MDQTIPDCPDRWVINGQIKLQTAMRIGTGKSTKASDAEDAPGILDIAEDCAGRPIIPASALKANVRRRMVEAGVPTETLARLLGRDPVLNADGTRQGQGGRVEFADASLVADHLTSNVVATVAQSARDARTLAAKDKMLRQSRVVEPETTFDVEIICDRVSQTDVTIVIEALHRLSDPGSNLGSGRGVGRGLCTWTPSQRGVLHLGPAEIVDWLKTGGDWRKAAIPQDLRAAARNSAPTKVVSVEIQLTFDSPFMVAGDVVATGDKSERAAVVEFVSKRHALPEASARGAIRAQAARILRTMGIEPETKNAGIASPFEWLFGKTGHKGALSFAEFHRVDDPKSETENVRQAFVAIDRFVGGGADGAKFQLTPAICPVFEGTISLDVDRPGLLKHKHAHAALGLLALLWRDLKEGDVAFGYGVNKGYGHATLTHVQLTHGDPAAIGKIDGVEVSETLCGLAAWHRDTPEFRTLVSDAVAALRKGSQPPRSSIGAELAPIAQSPPPDELPATKAPHDAAAAKTDEAKVAAPDTSHQFRNPYHFITHHEAEEQLKSDSLNAAGRTDAKAFQEDGPADGDAHDRYASDRLSGRVECALVCYTPVVVGSAQSSHTSGYTLIEPYRFQSKPAIPATTIKGLISSIAEAASGSAFRVLHNQTPVSSRQSMRGGLHAIGLVVSDATSPTGFAVRPLTLPLLDRISPKWEKAFATYANFKVYVGNYNRRIEAEREFAKSLVQTPPIAADQHYYMNVSAGGDFTTTMAWAGTNKNRINPRSAAQMPADPNHDNLLKTFPTAPSGWTRGFVRVLGREGRDGMPGNKKHELFIPYPEHAETAPTIAIPSDTMEMFAALAEERALAVGNDELVNHQRLPYLPFDRPEREASSWRDDKGVPVPQLKAGDLVYFDVDGTGPEKALEVSAISFSAIWRGGVRKRSSRTPADLHDFFDPEMLPYNNSRTTLSIAEGIFGFVSTTKLGKHEASPTYSAYAGRVRFSTARLEREAADDNVFETMVSKQTGVLDVDGIHYEQLKIQSSPKAPSPAMYFTRKSGPKAFAPDTLSLNKHRPQGRKISLHHAPPADNSDGQQWRPWRTKQPNADQAQKCAVRPLRAGTVFRFSADFTNLTRSELGLLCFALRPADLFRHKLGMGKNLGLGTVRIDPLAVTLIDRSERYLRDDIWAAPRATTHNVSGHYADQAADTPAGDSDGTPEALARSYDVWARQHWPVALGQLLQVGMTGHADGMGYGNIPVSTPVTRQQFNYGTIRDEAKTYEWHAQNNRRPEQGLTPIVPGRPLPLLEAK